MFNYHLVILIKLALEDFHDLLLSLHNVDGGIFLSGFFLLGSADMMKDFILLELSGRPHHVLFDAQRINGGSVEIKGYQQLGPFFRLRIFFFAWTRATRRNAWLFLSELSSCA